MVIYENIPKIEEKDEDKIFNAVDMIMNCLHQARNEGILALEEGLDDLWGYNLPEVCKNFTLVLFKMIVDGSDEKAVEAYGRMRIAATRATGAELLMMMMIHNGALMIQAGEHAVTVSCILSAMMGDNFDYNRFLGLIKYPNNRHFD